MNTKNPCTKKREVDQPYEIWKTRDESLEWRVLKKHNDVVWNCACRSPNTFGSWEYGDVPTSQVKEETVQTYIDYVVLSSRTTEEAMLEFFRDGDGKSWHVGDMEDGILAIDYAGGWGCIAFVSEERQQVDFVSSLPVVVPKEKQGVVSEFLTAANYGLNIGHFGMDFEVGEVRCSSVTVDAPVTTSILTSLVFNNLMIVDKHLPLLEKVINGELTPADAVVAAQSSELRRAEIEQPIEVLGW